jgi:ring-1,2-phenylacetyl-CoA epoxidase subunit PaaE
MDHSFYDLNVKAINAETEDAVTVVFEVPDHLSETFQYTQGQYLTLKFDFNGKEERRAYSMCSSPVDDDLAVTVKRLKGGVVSNYIHDKLKAGDKVAVMPPEGRFFTALKEEQKKDYYLFGAGSGITPLMSILKTILEKEPMSKVCLLYGNRNEDTIIFRESLDALEKRYRGQFVVEHILSQPKREKSGGMFGFLSKGTINWQGKVGRINSQFVKDFLAEHPARTGTAEYFICGPGSMITAVESALKDLKVDKRHIHTERFTTDVDEKDRAKGKAGAKIVVHMNGSVIETEVPEGKTILDVLLDLKYDPPYSCHSGACSTCMAKIIRGSVKMDACYALDDDEIADGYILTCQSHPTSDEVELTYDI